MRQKQIARCAIVTWFFVAAGGLAAGGPVVDIMAISDVFTPGERIDVWVSAVNPTHEFEVDVYLSAATDEATRYLSSSGWGTVEIPFIAGYSMPQFEHPLMLKLTTVMAGQLPCPSGQRCKFRFWITPSNVPEMIYSEDEAMFSTAPDGFVAVPSARFVMGKDEPGTGREHLIRHKVCLSSFFVSRYETTCAEFAEYLNSVNTTVTVDGLILDAYGDALGRIDAPGWPSHIEYADGSFRAAPGFETHPATAFLAGCEKYAEWRGARLPTEAQWEHAARAFADTDFPWGDVMSCDHANSVINSQGACKDNTVCVGSYEPNSIGLHDLIGNVSEFCSDTCDWGDIAQGKPSYYRWCLENCPSGVVDPKGPAARPDDTGVPQWRIERGGAYCGTIEMPVWARVPSTSNYWVGFRLVMMPPG